MFSFSTLHSNARWVLQGGNWTLGIFTGLKCSKITPLIFVPRWGKRLKIWDSERPIIIWENVLTLLKITPFLPAKSLKKIWIQLPPWLGWIYFYFLHTLEQYRTPAAWGCPNYARNSYGGWARSLAPPVHPRRDEGSPTHRGSVWNIRRTPWKPGLMTEREMGFD